MSVPVAGIARLVAFVIAGGLACAPGRAQRPPDPPTTPGVPPPVVVVTHPPLPSPTDAPLPDLGAIAARPNVADSPVRRFLGRLAPRCLDTVLHTCWSSPAAADARLPRAEREFAKDMEAGDLYFKEKNFRGAELRYLDALNYHPEDPGALFKLAQTEDRLGKVDDARELFEIYLDRFPNRGPTTELAKKTLRHYELTSTRPH